MAKVRCEFTACIHNAKKRTTRGFGLCLCKEKVYIKQVNYGSTIPCANFENEEEKVYEQQHQPIDYHPMHNVFCSAEPTLQHAPTLFSNTLTSIFSRDALRAAQESFDRVVEERSDTDGET